MRNFLFVIMSLSLAAAPAAAAEKKVGKRTAAPEELLQEMGAGEVDAELAAAIAAAAAHPLGTLQNPVRVGGPEGERAYLARLRCADGSAPSIGERSAGGVGAYGTVVALYPLDCRTAAPGKLGLVMDMYHAEHREDRAPAGLRIDPR